MTPAYFNAANAYAYVSLVFPTGELNPWYYITYSFGVRPVINIRSDVLISQGDGTSENPFILDLAI